MMIKKFSDHFLFPLISHAKLDESFRNEEIFNYLFFFNSSDLGFDSKIFFFQFDPDPESRNVADLPDPDS